MAISNELHVLIVGGGTTGLLIAQGLKKYGIKFTIFEGDSEDKFMNHQRDWSMALFWGADYIKSTLPDSLRARFDEIKVDRFYEPEVGHEDTLPFYNGKTGELVVRLPGGLATRVSRIKLRKLFAEDLDIQFNKRVADWLEYGDDVELVFTDGTSASGTTVVFCDGVKSAAGRDLLLGEGEAELAVSPCSTVNITHKYTAEQARFLRGTLNPVFKFASHPDDNTLFLLTTTDVPSLDEPENWVFQCLFTVWGQSGAETPAERLRIFKEQASAYAEPWRSAVKWLPDDLIIPRDRIKYWATPTPWETYNGQVTLAGDSAHPMVPFRAQGLNNAMRDAFSYVEAVRTVANGTCSRGTAINAYTKEVFGRGAKEIAISNSFGPLMHNWDIFMQSPLMKLNYATRAAPPKALVSQEEPIPTKSIVVVQKDEQPPLEKIVPLPLSIAVAIAPAPIFNHRKGNGVTRISHQLETLHL